MVGHFFHRKTRLNNFKAIYQWEKLVILGSCIVKFPGPIQTLPFEFAVIFSVCVLHIPRLFNAAENSSSGRIGHQRHQMNLMPKGLINLSLRMF